MIAIVDNGGTYSDHQILFFDVASAEEAATLVDTIRAMRSCSVHEDAKVLAVADRVDWWHGGSTKFEAWLAERAAWMMEPDDEELSRYNVIPMRWLERIESATRTLWTDGTFAAYMAARRT